jgi:hypothetical protein
VVDYECVSLVWRNEVRIAWHARARPLSGAKTRERGTKGGGFQLLFSHLDHGECTDYCGKWVLMDYTASSMQKRSLSERNILQVS